jgi:hypothetical protein
MNEGALFISPDSVEEVIRTNEHLSDGIEQAIHARTWLQSISIEQRSSLLRLPPRLPIETIECVVIGNGFVGSDYLALDPSIPIVDVRYLLRPTYSCGSIFKAIGNYNELIKEMSKPRNDRFQTTSMTLGGVKFEFPAVTLS